MERKREDILERIKELKVKIEQFNKTIQEKNNLIRRAQKDINQLVQGILTRQGGIDELKKLLEFDSNDKN